MIDQYKTLTINQYEAALCMLRKCVEQCPDENWNEPVVNLRFCQAVFHTAFFADVYLGRDVDSVRNQPFHREHADTFGDYEELSDRPPQTLYSKEFLNEYINHCRAKAAEVVAAETQEALDGPAGFDWLKFNRAELHVYNIRHIHHHAAQLSLRLRIDTGEGIPWVGSGWRDS